MAKGLSVQEQVAKWASQAGQAASAYKAGISKVQTAPTAKAAQNLDKAQTNYVQAIQNGTMAAKLNAVTLQQWQQMATTKGAANYTTGVQAGQAKYAAAMAKWIPIRNNIAAQVNQMPTTTYEQRKAKATAMMDAMHAAKVQGV